MLREIEEWNQLKECLVGVHLNDQRDKAAWRLNVSGKFTTKSLYRFITYAGVTDMRLKDIWQAYLPLKIKVFLWMVAQNRLS